jgi:hypothetical protein
MELDGMAARLGPQGAHTFSYKMHCEHMPCTVTLYAAMVVGHTTDGMALRVLLPHVVYVCEKQKNCRADVRKAAGLTN